MVHFSGEYLSGWSQDKLRRGETERRTQKECINHSFLPLDHLPSLPLPYLRFSREYHLE